MKPIIFLCILVICTACAPLSPSTVEPSPTFTATQPSRVTTEPTTTPLIVPTATPTLLHPSPTPLFDIVIDNVATGQQGQLYASGFSGQDNLRHYAQWDGAKWIELGNGFNTAGNSLAVDSAGNLYTEILKDSQQGIATAIMSWDGTRWEDITANFSIAVDALKAGRVSSNVPVMALAIDGVDHVYAAGAFYYPSADHTEELPMGYAIMRDKETWTVLGQGFDRANIYALTASATGNVYVSGEQPQTGFVAQWDGENWTQISTDKLNSCLLVTHLALDKDEGLYASCRWSEPGEPIFYWDGTDWMTISEQLEGEAPAVYDMAVDGNGHLYIGGSFDSVSGIPARNIAFWDGDLWYALGDGVNERVNALAFDSSGELYIVGFFSEAGGQPAYHAAMWDGEAWHAWSK